MDKIKLNILGISYSSSNTDAYILVLKEENGKKRIPIIIGVFEAQAIAITLEGLTPPRPLTHDLFVSLINEAKLQVKEVLINKLEEGVFYSEIYFTNNKKNTFKIDSRTSDAVAIAARLKCPIYIYKNILDDAGIDFDLNTQNKENIDEKEATQNVNKYNKYSIKKLKELLNEAIKSENYEAASKIRDEIKNRENKT